MAVTLVAETEPPEQPPGDLSPARQRLRQAQAARRLRGQAVEQAQRAIGRLRAVIGSHASAVERLAGLRERAAGEMADLANRDIDMLTNPVRLAVADKLREAEVAVEDGAAAADAAQRGLPQIERQHAAAMAAHREQVAEVNASVIGVLAEEAERLAGELREAEVELLVRKARLIGLWAVMDRAGPPPGWLGGIPPGELVRRQLDHTLPDPPEPEIRAARIAWEDVSASLFSDAAATVATGEAPAAAGAA